MPVRNRDRIELEGQGEVRRPTTGIRTEESGWRGAELS